MSVLFESRVAVLPCVISGILGSLFSAAMIQRLSALEADTVAGDLLLPGRMIGYAFLAFFALLIVYGLSRPRHRLEVEGATFTITDRHLIVRQRRIDIATLASARFIEVASEDDARSTRFELIDRDGRALAGHWYTPAEAAEIRNGLQVASPTLPLQDARAD